jgi:DNA-binding NarL/FixJ family response regulator
MKVILYSEDLMVLYNWKQKITICDSNFIEDINNLHLHQNTLLVLDYTYCYKTLLKIISASRIYSIKILLLDRVPTFDKGKNFLTLGVYGYGNILMNSVYLNSAIETITNQMIWIYPEFTTSLIQGFHKEKNIPNEMIQLLTSREIDIALLIKDGLSNNEISEQFQISINTVKSHIKNIYEKLNVKNRLSLSLLFRKQSD